MSANRPPPSGLVTAVLGPTNTGKTHLALERMLGHDTGMIGLPLRLLAREVYDKVAEQKGKNQVALITGEERILPRSPKYFVSTVEAMPQNRDVEFVAIDEIQLADDRDRGHIFTDRLLHVRGSEETMLLGAETIRPLIKSLLPYTRFVTRPRFSDLTFAGSKKLSRLPRRSAIVAFSAEEVYAIAELIRRQRGGAAVVMGALSPRTRNAQVALYQAGEVDYLVATDAIGMGLNMDVDHVAFASLTKFDGLKRRPLRVTELSQIAGRAGRYMNDGTFGTTADATALDADTIERIEGHQFDPLRQLMWRNRNLNFSSPSALVTSLEMPAQKPGLTRTRNAIDVVAFKALSRDGDLRPRLGGPARVKQLWEICQIPDFRKVMIDEHIDLLRALCDFLLTEEHEIPEDWLSRRIAQTESTEGDIDTISNRIAHCRTWTFISNRSGWLRDAPHWQERTRQIEEKLSDALHEKLTKQFVDRRTSVLVKSLRERVDLLAGVSEDGEVTVEGHYVGSLQGLQFNSDPRAAGIHGRALRNAATKALGGEIRKRAGAFLDAGDEAITLSDNGKLWWQGAATGRLKKGKDWISPLIDLPPIEQIDAATHRKVRDRLQTWITARIGALLPSMVSILDSLESKAQTKLTANARGLFFRLFENYGWLDRRAVSTEVRAIDKDQRALLRGMGVRIGEFVVWIPALLKPQATDFVKLLYKVWKEDTSLSIPALTNNGLTSLPVDSSVDPALYSIAGYMVCGPRCVRVDVIEKLANLVREETKPLTHFVGDAKADEDIFIQAMIGKHVPTAGGRTQRGRTPFVFALSPRMSSLVGCNEKELASILSALGFRRYKDDKTPRGVSLWRRTSGKVKARPAKKRKHGGSRQDNGRKGEKRGNQSPFSVLEKLQSTN